MTKLININEKLFLNNFETLYVLSKNMMKKCKSISDLNDTSFPISKAEIRCANRYLNIILDKHFFSEDVKDLSDKMDKIYFNYMLGKVSQQSKNDVLYGKLMYDTLVNEYNLPLIGDYIGTFSFERKLCNLANVINIIRCFKLKELEKINSNVPPILLEDQKNRIKNMILELEARKIESKKTYHHGLEKQITFWNEICNSSNIVKRGEENTHRINYGTSFIYEIENRSVQVGTLAQSFYANDPDTYIFTDHPLGKKFLRKKENNIFEEDGNKYKILKISKN